MALVVCYKCIPLHAKVLQTNYIWPLEHLAFKDAFYSKAYMAFMFNL